MTWSLHGKGVSRGIALGIAHVVRRDALEIYEYSIAEQDVEAEIARFEAATEAFTRGLAQAFTALRTDP